MSGFASLPRARSEGLITTETASDLLIYDVERNELHTLNAVAAAVWRAADGQRSVLDLALHLAIDHRVVQDALRKLSSAELLTGYSGEPKKVSSASRRRMLRSAAVAGAMVLSVSAPMAASANSSCFGTQQHNKNCTVGNPCWTGGGVGNGNCGTCKASGDGSDSSKNICNCDGVVNCSH